MHSLLSTCHVVHIPFCRSCHQFVATFYVSPCFFPLLLCGGEQGSDSLEMSCGFCCFSTSPNPERDHALFIWFVICSATYWIIHLKKTPVPILCSAHQPGSSKRAKYFFLGTNCKMHLRTEILSIASGICRPFVETCQSTVNGIICTNF